jgi:hypothetical protein
MIHRNNSQPTKPISRRIRHSPNLLWFRAGAIKDAANTRPLCASNKNAAPIAAHEAARDTRVKKDSAQTSDLRAQTPRLRAPAHRLRAWRLRPRAAYCRLRAARVRLRAAQTRSRAFELCLRAGMTHSRASDPRSRAAVSRPRFAKPDSRGLVRRLIAHESLHQIANIKQHQKRDPPSRESAEPDERPEDSVHDRADRVDQR